MNVADIEPGQPVPKETYGTTLSRILNALTEIFAGDELNTTMLVSDSDYDVNFRTLTTLKNLRIHTRDTGEKYHIYHIRNREAKNGTVSSLSCPDL
jgi:uncharacterized lipoprotein